MHELLRAGLQGDSGLQADDSWQTLVLSYFITAAVIATVTRGLLGTSVSLSCLFATLGLAGFIAYSLYVGLMVLKNFGGALTLSFSFLLIAAYTQSKFALPVLLVLLTAAHFNIAHKVHVSVRRGSIFAAFPAAVAIAFLTASIVLAGDRLGTLSLENNILGGEVAGDTVFHVAIASMIKHYGIASTGVHGLHPISYHVLSHRLLGGLSAVLGCSTIQAYSVLFPVVFAPLLPLTVLGVSATLRACVSRIELLTRACVAFCVFCVVVPHPFMQSAALVDSYICSESYLFALVLLCGIMAAIAMPSPILRLSCLFILTALSLLAKISVGTIACVLVVFWLLVCDSATKRLRLSAAAGISVFAIIQIIRIWLGNQGLHGTIVAQNYLWNISYYGKTGVPGSLLVSLKMVVLFLLGHFVVTWVTLGLLLLKVLLKKNFSLWSCKVMTTWILIATGFGFLAVFFMSGMGGAFFYFSNVAMFVSLPVLCILIPDLFVIPFSIRTSVCCVLGLLIALVLLRWGMNYGVPYLQAGYGRLTVPFMSMSQEEIAFRQYLEQLRTIARDPVRDCLVYIPKQVTMFWGNRRVTAEFALPFLATALTEKPGLYMLPLRSDPESVIWRQYGYGVYPDGLWKTAKERKVSSEVLMDETRRLGFNAHFHLCKGTANKTMISITKDRGHVGGRIN